jgi:hypothetical protein
MKYTRLITLLAASTMLATFSANAYDKDGAVYDKDGDGKKHHHKKHHKPMHRYTLTGGATYLAPTMNGLDYVTTETLSGTTETYDPENINPNYSWGYFLAFGYMISSHYDIQASWQQFNSNQEASTNFAGPGEAYTSSLTSSAFVAGEVGSAESTEVLDTQSFDATLGQYHKLSSMLTARPFVGVKYAQVNDKTTNEYASSGAAIPAGYQEVYNSKFSGAGPEVGLDAEYKIVQHFGVTGHLAAAFLVGDLQTSTDISNTASGLIDDIDGEKNNRVIPSLDAKLGLNWNSLYAHDSFGIGIEGGYQVAYYFDVVDQVQDTSTGLVHNYSDVGIMGPYMNLSARF